MIGPRESRSHPTHERHQRSLDPRRAWLSTAARQALTCVPSETWHKYATTTKKKGQKAKPDRSQGYKHLEFLSCIRYYNRDWSRHGSTFGRNSVSAMGWKPPQLWRSGNRGLSDTKSQSELSGEYAEHCCWGLIQLHFGNELSQDKIGEKCNTLKCWLVSLPEGISKGLYLDPDVKW